MQGENNMGWTYCPPEQVPAELLAQRSPAPGRKTRSRLRADFIRHLTRWGCYRDAAARTGIDERTARRWREWDPEFARRCDVALGTHHEYVRGEAYRRVMNPEVKPVWHRGREVGHVQRVTDAMLMRLLGRLRP